MATDCAFCKIASGDIPAKVLARDGDLVAFADLHPAAPTHALVIPTRHVATVADLGADDAELAGRMLLLGNRVAREAGIADSGYRLVLNCNSDGGQSVYHVHLHVLGGRAMAWPPG